VIFNNVVPATNASGAKSAGGRVGFMRSVSIRVHVVQSAFPRGSNYLVGNLKSKRGAKHQKNVIRHCRASLDTASISGPIGCCPPGRLGSKWYVMKMTSKMSSVIHWLRAGGNSNIIHAGGANHPSIIANIFQPFLAGGEVDNSAKPKKLHSWMGASIKKRRSRKIDVVPTADREKQGSVVVFTMLTSRLG
jgi:hypothetical protein